METSPIIQQGKVLTRRTVAYSSSLMLGMKSIKTAMKRVWSRLIFDPKGSISVNNFDLCIDIMGDELKTPVNTRWLMKGVRCELRPNRCLRLKAYPLKVVICSNCWTDYVLWVQKSLTIMTKVVIYYENIQVPECWMLKKKETYSNPVGIVDDAVITTTTAGVGICIELILGCGAWNRLWYRGHLYSSNTPLVMINGYY